MAKLNPIDPQFGIPVATRIRKEVAFEFNEKAGKEDKTLSRYLAEFIEKGILNGKQLRKLQAELAQEKQRVTVYEKQVKDLQSQFIKEKESSRKVAGRLILEVTQGDKKQTMQLIETYNTILKDEKRNNS